MIRNTPKNAEPTAKAKLPPFVRGLLCIGTVLLVCFVVSIVLEVWYCKSAPNAAIKLAACLVLDAFAFLLPGVVANMGVEYRTYKSGWFYGGLTYHRPFGDLATAEFTWYGADNLGRTIRSRIGGSYLTIDLRYYFHADPDRPRRRSNER